MTRLILLLAFICTTVVCKSQDASPESSQLQYLIPPDYDSLEKMVAAMKEDTLGANLLGKAAYHFAFHRPEEGVIYGQRGIQLSNRIGYKKGVALCNRSLAMSLWGVGNYRNALQAGLNALRLYEELNDKEGIAYTYYVVGVVYRDFGDYNRARDATLKGLSIYRQLKENDIVGYANLGAIYDLQGNLDSASVNIQRAAEATKKINYNWSWLDYMQGNIWRKKKQFDSALFYYRAALQQVEKKDVVETYNGLAMLYRETGRIDSCIYYANEVVTNLKSVAYQRGILQACVILVEAYKHINERDSVIKYLELSIALNNELYGQQSERNIQRLAFEEQTRQDELVRQKERENARLRLYLILSAASILLVMVFLLWRNNRHRRNAYEILQKQKEETDMQKAMAVKALNDLKAAQLQLIQSEKMASLGEITAGIAHEIQNPLNFVNNFSEVNKELIDELKSELATGNLKLANEIAETIKANEDKINNHGKRADSIVKGMLQHSRASTGQKELTDINALVDEYSRLAYHGLRSRENIFKATRINIAFETVFDPTLPNINVVRQDIGRVILNLVNNAFYAVSERKTHEQGGYEPAVVVRTKKTHDKIEIKVKDNGNGIPQKIMDKIFQPFFTTKPTGQGTGLGLSLSYDIVKAHGGNIHVETSERQGSEFIVQLPI